MPPMKKSRGRIAVVFSSLAALPVLVAAGFASRDLLVEEWHLYKLRNGSEVEKRRALAKLGELRSVKTAPILIDLIQRSHDPEWPQRYLFSFPSECSNRRSWRIAQIYERW